MHQPLELIDDLWRDQSVWSQVANKMKTRIDRARLAALCLVILVALAGTTAAALASALPAVARLLAGLAAIGSAILPMLRPAWSGQALRDWTRARSVSEGLKGEVYLWLARAGRYNDDAGAAKLKAKTDEIKVDGADLDEHCEGVEPVRRPIPDVYDLPSYFRVRVAGQIDGYYKDRLRLIRSRIKMFRHIEIALGFMGALIGVTAALTGPSLAAWITVIATVGTAVSVHVSAMRYEFQRIEFVRTSRKLQQLQRAANESFADDQLTALAVSAENVISVENQAWMVKLGEDPPDQKAATGK